MNDAELRETLIETLDQADVALGTVDAASIALGEVTFRVRLAIGDRAAAKLLRGLADTLEALTTEPPLEGRLQ